MRVGRLALIATALPMIACGGTAKRALIKSRTAAIQAVVAGSPYLALGDSYTFGYLEYQVVPHPNYADPSRFVGYPEQLGAELHLNVVNLACPGETSASMINALAISNGCENSLGNRHNGYRRLHPLHVHYRGSQLGYAVSYLRSHPDVRLVSLMLGLNDWRVCIKTTNDRCASAAEQTAARQRVRDNIRRILSAIRNEAHYRGQLAIVNYPSPFIRYNSAIVALNRAIDTGASPFGVVVADGFGVFQAADRNAGGSACAAGLLTRLGRHGRCGIHPSYSGQALLAHALEKVIQH